MEKNNDSKKDYSPNLSLEMEDLLLDYHGFNLKTLAKKIRLKSVKAKPNMIFY